MGGSRGARAGDGPAAVAEPCPAPAAAPAARDPYDVAARSPGGDRAGALAGARRRRAALRRRSPTCCATTSRPRRTSRRRERTTTELRWSLPPALLERAARRERFDPLFDEADLVKFARLRPDAADAAAFLRDARALLTERVAIGARAGAAEDRRCDSLIRSASCCCSCRRPSPGPVAPPPARARRADRLPGARVPGRRPGLAPEPVAVAAGRAPAARPRAPDRGARAAAGAARGAADPAARRGTS